MRPEPGGAFWKVIQFMIEWAVSSVRSNGPVGWRYSNSLVKTGRPGAPEVQSPVPCSSVQVPTRR
ncbi:hypothetical protein ACFVH7_31200 [Kitasatospora indigofera]|uniref:hypothetical protein n=1 Tax=Kitasatospora indigofera TaxID=67307 RepID=UPI003634662C